jgi:protease I
MTDRARTILYVIAPERFRDEELLEPRRALEAAGHRVTVASTRTGPAIGMLGARVDVAASLREVRAEDFDMLVFAGGAGAPAHLWESAAAVSLARAMFARGRPVAAICLSGPVLARAGVLAGKRATVYPETRAILEMKRGGATLVDDPVVVEGIIVTARGPEAAPAFGAALVNLLGP